MRLCFVNPLFLSNASSGTPNARAIEYALSPARTMCTLRAPVAGAAGAVVPRLRLTRATLDSSTGGVRRRPVRVDPVLLDACDAVLQRDGAIPDVGMISTRPTVRLRGFTPWFALTIRSTVTW